MAGMTRTAIRDHFKRNVRSGLITAALELLKLNGRVACEVVRGVGRPSERWRAVEFPRSTTPPPSEPAPSPEPFPRTATDDAVPASATLRKRPRDLRDMTRPELESYAMEIGLMKRALLLS